MRITAIVVAALLTATLCGCGSQPEQLGDSSASAVSALRTSALALELDADGRAWRPSIDTALADALTELGDASRSTIELVPADAHKEQARDEVADKLQQALTVVAGARAALAQGEPLAPWVERLEDAASALEETAR